MGCVPNLGFIVFFSSVDIYSLQSHLLVFGALLKMLKRIASRPSKTNNTNGFIYGGVTPSRRRCQGRGLVLPLDEGCSSSEKLCHSSCSTCHHHTRVSRDTLRLAAPFTLCRSVLVATLQASPAPFTFCGSVLVATFQASLSGTVNHCLEFVDIMLVLARTAWLTSSTGALC